MPIARRRCALRLTASALALAPLLCCLPPAAAAPVQQSFADMVGDFLRGPAGKPDSEMLAKATMALNHLQNMALPQASRSINEALQLAPGNSQLHFLNAFIYHLQAKQGDAQKNEMAIEGYQQALRIDPGNWIAQEFLGLAYLDHGRFAEARTQFADVLMMTPESQVAINGLMTAAYLTGDAVTACVMADQMARLPLADPGKLRSVSAVYAACGKFDEAARVRAQLGKAAVPADLERLDRRVAQWTAFYARQPQRSGGSMHSALLTADSAAAASIVPTQAFQVPAITLPATRPAAPVGADAPAAAGTIPVPVPVPPAMPKDTGPRMVLVDVVLVSAQDLVSTSKGINLLNALTLQLGSSVGNLPAFSRVFSSLANGTAAASSSTTITRAVTVPALSYSLNIANANNAVNEVLARPTLAAIEGLPSEFFSGTNLSAGVVSASPQGGTTIVPLEKRFGIKLAVTPVFLSNQRVQLKVEAQRTSLNASVENPKVAYQIESGEITANANVVMNLGDTLVLSGLSEKSSAQTRDGVPVLQDLPGLQYLFSNKKTSDIQRSVLMLITPRIPVHLAQASAEPAGPVDPAMLAVREQFGFKGDTPANTDAILAHLKTNALFREFRQSDVAIERWEQMDSTWQRLRQALDFLYY